MFQGPKWNAFREILAVIQALTVITGVVFAVINIRLAADSLTVTKTIHSASFLLQVSKIIEGPQYKKILSAINNHPGTYPLLGIKSKKQFSDEAVENYVAAFETLGTLIHAKVVDPKMVYDELGYDLEKAWCNHDVRKVIADLRRVDGIESGPSAYYYGFEELAKFSLTKDKKSCDDMDKE